MTFYSVDYLSKQNTLTNTIVTLLLALTFVLLAAGLVATFRHRFNTRYRDLTIIAFLMFLFFAGVQFTNLQSTNTKNAQQTQMSNFVKSYVRNEKIKNDGVSFNSTSLVDGMIAKEGSKYYQIGLAKDGQSYSRTQVYLINAKVEVKE
ncbi:DUF3290 family protein [Fructobacillus ficulneus]|uniref:DUF3290 domain-containing protein n=1 Tax=Fructobacillus ficulneus TaxID=157463 RepID=A0A0K8MGP0_9LACO|nr:DUF3290 family protein [Fructobacillus ficulneus]GAO99363.1 hypothetical protein FFIC_091910 [Fructobacillus ficulneus]